LSSSANWYICFSKVLSSFASCTGVNFATVCVSWRDNFEYCIFLINTNFHGETFSDATFYGAIFNEVGNFGGVKFNNGVSFNSAKFIKYASFATAKFNDEVSFNLAKFNKNVAFGGTELPTSLNIAP
jgi:uncharacterized protein YjbI with pentapeptide repeats